MFHYDHTIRSYHTRARPLAARYDTLTPSTLHAQLLPHLPPPPARVLDIGAGSGRDAAFFAGRGFQVIAVEPARALREVARVRHPDPNIRWLEDRLPELTALRELQLDAELIWLSAVWMHVAPADRTAALGNLVSLLRPGGRLVITLRIGPPPPDMIMHPVSGAELTVQARCQGLCIVHHGHASDAQGRTEIRWEKLILARS